MTLTVVLDDRGMLVSKPARAGLSNNEVQVASDVEDTARRAVEACAPYELAAVAGQKEVFQITFGSK